MSTRHVTGVSNRAGATPVGPAPGNYSRPLAVVTILFFVWGMLTSLNDILIPHLKSIFELEFPRTSDAGPVRFLFSLFLVLTAVVESPEHDRISKDDGHRSTCDGGRGWPLYSRGVSCLCIHFFPDCARYSLPAELPAFSWRPILTSSPREKLETAATRLNLTQAFNSFGSVIGPKLGGSLTLSATLLAVAQLRLLSPERLYGYRVQQAALVKMPYTIIAIVLVLSASALGGFKLPGHRDPEGQRGLGAECFSWDHSNLIFGAVAIFTYGGAEVLNRKLSCQLFGSARDRGTLQQRCGGFRVDLLGRRNDRTFSRLGTPPADRRGAPACCLCDRGGDSGDLSMLGSGHPAMWSMILVGFFNSIMFPTIFTLGVAEPRALTARGSGILNMAIVGGAILLIQGVIADRFGLHHAFFLSLLCYLYIVFYWFDRPENAPE